jgi:hypothetical protein
MFTSLVLKEFVHHLSPKPQSLCRVRPLHFPELSYYNLENSNVTEMFTSDCEKNDYSDVNPPMPVVTRATRESICTEPLDPASIGLKSSPIIGYDAFEAAKPG